MRIYLVRHATAVNASIAGTDSARFLDLDGRETARGVGKVLADNGDTFAHVISSPYVRAIQTAELVCQQVGYEGTINTELALTPEASPEPFVSRIAQARGPIAIFGHEPNISHLASLLVGQPGFQPFRPGQVCAFDGARPRFKVHPEALQIQDMYVPS